MILTGNQTLLDRNFRLIPNGAAIFTDNSTGFIKASNFSSQLVNVWLQVLFVLRRDSLTDTAEIEVNVVDCTFENNIAQNDGGAIHINSNRA